MAMTMSGEIQLPASRDVVWQKVSPEAARESYGVVLTGAGDSRGHDEHETTKLRSSRTTLQEERRPFFDRGPGYARLAGGSTSADVDWIDS